MTASSGTPTLVGNPFEEKPDFFSTHGYRHLAIQAVVLTLEELTCDPSSYRSGPERAEMAALKDAAEAWFDSAAFESFALMIAPAEPIEQFRRSCLTRPKEVRDTLLRIQATFERRKDWDVAAHNWTRGAPSNCWPFVGDDVRPAAAGTAPLREAAAVPHALGAALG